MAKKCIPLPSPHTRFSESLIIPRCAIPSVACATLNRQTYTHTDLCAYTFVILLGLATPLLGESSRREVANLPGFVLITLDTRRHHLHEPVSEPPLPLSFCHVDSFQLSFGKDRSSRHYALRVCTNPLSISRQRSHARVRFVPRRSLFSLALKPSRVCIGMRM